MERLSILLASLLLLVSAASATSIIPPDELVNLTEDNTDKLKSSYNENMDQIPGIAKKLIGDQRINLYLENQSLRAEMDQARIETLEKDKWEEPSLEIWMDTKDATEILESEEPGKELQQKLKSDDIRYQEHGIVNRLKFAVIGLFI